MEGVMAAVWDDAGAGAGGAGWADSPAKAHSDG